MTTSNPHPSIVDAQVIENLEVAPDHFRLALRLSGAFAVPHPGQFVMIREPERREPLLPRPLSVYGFRRQNGQTILDLLYRVSGRGTALFSHLKKKAILTVLGPLGHGFTVPPDIRKVILVAGGVGIAPLTFLLRQIHAQISGSEKMDITGFVGARTTDLLIGLDRLRDFCDLRTATDDGSTGYPGTVTDRLKCDLNDYRPEETLIFACGPIAMIRSLALMLRGTAFRCQVSLEERMACGVGACLGCAVEVADREGGTSYQRVCYEGPVFDIAELFNAVSVTEKEKKHDIG